MINNFYTNSLEFFIENNINLSNDQLIYLGLLSNSILDESVSSDYINSFIENSYDYNPLILQESAKGLNPSSLKKIGVNQIKSPEPILNQSAKTAGMIIKNQGITKESRKTLHTLFNDTMEKLSDCFEIVTDKIPGGKNYEAKKLKQAVVLTLFTVLMNTLSLNIVLPFCKMDTQKAMNITTVIIGPIIEETSKEIASRKNIDKEFQFIFNLTEFSNYIYGIRKSNKLISDYRSGLDLLGMNTDNVPKEMPMKNALRARSAPVAMHITNQAIHHAGNNSKSNDKDKKAKRSFFAYLTSIIVHIVWNSLGTFSPKFTSLIVGKY